ncbi:MULTISPECIES: cellulose synthase subunit BcsC-related outer membrane protein [unclassified Undibacterium]|uniref:cellulose synthase subunit BcsC-related outer membrane protein n=2 Tax=Pseudomonadota TaxID=1224 RepID=UPI002AC92872|nr:MULTISPECIES: cellulose synthase subunit BcsC-related outer membrane protein [unclassified Undibacterium]MEB0213703.1 cellulose synthase subunit BcsC-related outer membrane protein [Undibacterium sp. 5I2]WPX43868.1 cellulose synthase subunit BcsC-related outer membrane protein [Undibacterium sp. CCC3.4]
MVFKRKAIALAFLAISMEGTSAFATSTLQQQLLEQAQFWEQRGRDDHAADAWAKLLKVDPDNLQALVAVGMQAARSGNPEQAKICLAKLRSLNASASQQRLVEEALRRGPVSAGRQLDDARRLARQGDSEAAADSFRLLGDPSRLKGDAALEYYQVLAGTKSGYDEAQRGLEKLSKDTPANLRYALAYAQVLSYRQVSRVSSLGLLESLSSKPEVATAATAAWRQALSWMGLEAGNSKFFRAYLERHPGDQAIADKLAALARQSKETALESRRTGNKPERSKAPEVNISSAGFKALDANDLALAEKEFQTLIKRHPKDPVGHGGMGLVKMRQEEFIAARKYLLQATRLGGAKGQANWHQAYDSANYWAIIEEARSAFEDADSAKGIALLRKAIALNGKEPSGILQLADALQAENDMAGAEANFKQVYNEDKTNMRALDGLIGVYVLQKRLKDLEALSPSMLPRHFAILANLKAEEFSATAKRLLAAGDLNGAQAALEDAILVKPEDAWLRMSLAKIYLQRNMPAQAQALLDALTNVAKPDPEALYVSALLSQMQQLWWEGLMTLERVPVAARKGELLALQKRLWIHVQLDRLELLSARGNSAEVNKILLAIEAAAGKEPEYLGTVAALYIRLGDAEHGLAMMRQAVQESPKPSAELLLAYGSTLMQMNQEAELDAVMRRVAALPKLSEAEVRTFRQLQKALSMRYAERSREAGDYAAAYTYLQPLLISEPQDPLLLLALARIYASAGEADVAKTLYLQVLQTEPNNPEVLQGLLFAAMSLKDYDGAEQQLEKLLRLQPDNPRFIALAGNVARARGQNGRALDYFKRALALEQARRPLAGRGVDGLRLVATVPVANDFKLNPFALAGSTPPAAGPQLKQVPQLSAQYAVANLPAAALPSAAPAPTGARLAAVAPLPAPLSVPVLPAASVAPQSVAPLLIVPNPAITPSLPSAARSGLNAVAPALLPALAPVATAAPVSASVASPLNSRAATRRYSQGYSSSVSPEEAALIKEIDDLSALNRSEVTLGLAARARSGQSGLSQLKDIETPLEVQLSTLSAGQFGLKIIPVLVDAGTLNLNDSGVAGLFGRNTVINGQATIAKLPLTSVAAQQGLSNAASISQVAKGVALSLSYQLSGFKADLGSSPIGFPIRTVVGGLRWSDQIESWNYSIEVARRSVTDSYLSYAGAKDSLYGLSWGGVSKNGVRLETAYDTPEGGLYLGAGLARLSGTNVLSNRVFDLGGGIYWRAYRRSDMLVTTGLGLTSMFYQKNLQNFTYGNGGYFSPQSYVALNLPVEVSGRSGKLAYQLGAAIGIQHFRSDAAPYYPLVSADQTALELFVAANPGSNLSSTYAAASHTGLQYKLGAALEYLLTPQFALGGRLSVDNSGDFTDAAALLYLRYTFEPRRGPVAFPPVAPKPYYQGN